jgi:hypothetical protein
MLIWRKQKDQLPDSARDMVTISVRLENSIVYNKIPIIPPSYRRTGYLVLRSINTGTQNEIGGGHTLTK